MYSFFHQMWVLLKALPITEPGIHCTGPAPLPHPSPDTQWTRLGREPLTRRLSSPCQRMTIHMCSPWMNARSKNSAFLFLYYHYMPTTVRLILKWTHFKIKDFLWSSLFTIHRTSFRRRIVNVNKENPDSLNAWHHFHE